MSKEDEKQDESSKSQSVANKSGCEETTVPSF